MGMALVPNGIEDFGLDHLGKHGFGAEWHQGSFGLAHLSGHGFGAEWHRGF